MNTILKSDNISLQFNDDITENSIVNQLYRTLRGTAIEPGQSSSPDFASFSDACLLCAKIVKNSPPADTTEGGSHDSLFDIHPLDESILDPPQSSFLAPTAPPLSMGQTLGLIYVFVGPASQSAGEANIGVIIHPTVQRRGHAREAVQLVLRWAFEDIKFHRVQAAILDTPTKDRAMRLFIGSGFVHEGTKRRAVFQSDEDGVAGAWKDVTYLAMLDTEWMLKSTWMRGDHADQPVASVWDEMFTRHSKEQEELVRWEEKHGRVRRTSSTETLGKRRAAQDITYLTDDATSISGSEASRPPSPRLNIIVNWDCDVRMAGGADFDERWEDVVETSFATRRQRRRVSNTSLTPSMQGHMLALPSIPSTRLSEGNPQSPLTIPSPSTPGATPPPFSPSPSPTPSSVHSTWSDTEDEDEDEDEDELSPAHDFTPTQAPIPIASPHDAYPPSRIAAASLRTRSRTSSLSSADSWSDAQSSIDSSSWDIVSDMSDDSSRGRAH